MFDSVLVANRGEIALRVVRTCQRLGVKAVAVHSEADAKALHVAEADESVLLGPAAAAESYLDQVKVIEAARQTGAQAIHPGYGFLAESPAFAQAVIDAGLVWVGPTPAAMGLLADKAAARSLMVECGIPVSPGIAVADVAGAMSAAKELGYPLMVKPVNGGGGIGMTVVYDDDQLATAVASAGARVARFFDAGGILLERVVEHARHIEVQVLGLADGRVVTVGDRECSVQRRHQKLAEESPAAGVTPAVRRQLLAAATTAAEAVGYRNAGTVEFLVSGEDFVFLEMNTRLQVEHTVTELVHGIDLVEQQLLIAAGEEPSYDVDAAPTGHALELRVCAEDPVRFLPGPGAITRWQEPAGEGVRVDAGYREGDAVTPDYDSLLAKLVVWGATRDEALARARAAVDGFVVEGPKVNLPFFVELLGNEEFVRGTYDTGLVERMRTT